jgi:Protein of unknown function (DUF4058)
MAIYSEKNLYPGINPHLNSMLQQPDGDWQSFHAYHLINIAQILNQILPSGYKAKPEQSLQIKIYNPPDEIISKSRGDVLIIREHPFHEQPTASVERSAPTLTLPMTQVITEMDELTALVIYKGNKPITRIELLSPANKPPGSHYPNYLAKRNETLYSGLRFVEIDYLHERRPTTHQLFSYADNENGAYPYHVIVFDPRPTFEQGKIDFYGFGALSPMPLVPIPLDGDENVKFDFGEAYNMTFSERPFCEEVDYTHEPVNFAAYSTADCDGIRQHMTKIASEYGA